jgi:hypothetical protein
VDQFIRQKSLLNLEHSLSRSVPCTTLQNYEQTWRIETVQRKIMRVCLFVCLFVCICNVSYRPAFSSNAIKKGGTAQHAACNVQRSLNKGTDTFPATAQSQLLRCHTVFNRMNLTANTSHLLIELHGQSSACTFPTVCTDEYRLLNKYFLFII